ncbi:MAG: AraC family transcriptional regulator [Leptospira sp.]|nr:AraC family transcriptional regulator [Leptospira sp.]
MIFPNELIHIEDENYIKKICQYSNWVNSEETQDKIPGMIKKIKSVAEGESLTLKTIHLAEGIEVSYIKIKSQSTIQLEREDINYPYLFLIPLQLDISEERKMKLSTDGIQCENFPANLSSEKEIKVILINVNMSFLKSHFTQEFLDTALSNISMNPESRKEGLIFLSEYFQNIGNSLVEIFSSSIPLSNDKQKEYFLFRTYDALFRILFITKNYNINVKNKIRYSNIDINRIFRARELLIADLENPPNISELAKKVSLNTSKLKAGFKEIYKDTIYGYLSNYRLDLTYNMILNEGLNVTEAATSIGYSSLSKFSIAFKKKFGINPSYLLKMRQNKSSKVAV